MSKKISFTDLNKIVEDLLNENLDKITIGDICFYKLIQHGVIYYEKRSQQKLIQHYFKKNSFVYFFFLFFKNLFGNGKIIKKNLKKVLLFDSDRTVSVNNEDRSQCFHKIKTLLRKNKVDFSYFTKERGDFSINNLKKNWKYKLFPTYEVIKLHYCCRKLINNLNQLGWDDELVDYISSSLHIFIEEFRFYNNLFSLNIQIEKILLITHYHQEGLIYAAKKKSINIVELQHGLISKNDLYYVYAKELNDYISKCLFCDSIFVFGNYWKKILEFGSEYNGRIYCVGDYKTDEKSFFSIKKENIILITSQKTMHNEYIKYVLNLSKIINYSKWTILVKLHPSEPMKEKYDKLKKVKNVEIVDNLNLSECFMKSKIHISIYSTTLYDAINYDVINLSLQNYSVYNDYASEIIKSKIALPINFDDNPLKFQIQNNQRELLFYYDYFNENKVLNHINLN